MASSRRLVQTVKHAKAQMLLAEHMDPPGKNIMRKETEHALVTIVRIAVRAYVDCYATADGMEPRLTGTRGKTYLIHDSYSNRSYPYCSGWGQMVEHSVLTPPSSNGHSSHSVFLLEATVDTTTVTDNPWWNDEVKARKGVIVTKTAHSPVPPLHIHNLRLLLRTGVTSIPLHGSNCNIVLTVPIPYMPWVQRDSFHTLWVLTRWTRDGDGTALPDPIRAYIVHLIRDTAHPHEDCAYCTLAI
jgi:hypothetical protein